MGYGVHGAAIARIITEGTNVLVLFYILKRRDVIADNGIELKFSTRCFEDCLPYLKVAVPIGSLLTLEYLSYEFYSF